MEQSASIPALAVVKHPMVPAAVGEGDNTSPIRFRVLFILFLVSMCNLLDRQLVSILAGHIKLDMNLSDEQLGMIGGFAFALFYSSVAIPVAWLADRYSRKWIITSALVIWSGFTALCGISRNFGQLFLCRVGVGFGESGCTAPGYSLIAAYFPRTERTRALATYHLGIPFGTAGGVLIGGIIASQIGWRAAFMICGVIGIMIAPLLMFFVPEPPRKVRSIGVSSGGVSKGFYSTIKILASKPSYWLMVLAASFGSIGNYGIMFWTPSFFERSYHLTIGERTIYFASILFIGGVIGNIAGGYLGDRLGIQNRKNYAYIPACAEILAVIFLAIALLSRSFPVTYICIMISVSTGPLWLSPVVTAIQHVVLPEIQATASAIFLLSANLIGLSGGTFLLGTISDRLTPGLGPEALRYTLATCLLCFAVSAVSMAIAARWLAHDWEDNPS